MRPSHILILLIVLILLFGAAKLPDLARSLGKSARILKEEAKELVNDSDGTKGAPKEKTTGCCQSEINISQEPKNQTQQLNPNEEHKHTCGCHGKETGKSTTP